jgi:hypothetical protein
VALSFSLPGESYGLLPLPVPPVPEFLLLPVPVPVPVPLLLPLPLPVPVPVPVLVPVPVVPVFVLVVVPVPVPVVPVLVVVLVPELVPVVVVLVVLVLVVLLVVLVLSAPPQAVQKAATAARVSTASIRLIPISSRLLASLKLKPEENSANYHSHSGKDALAASHLPSVCVARRYEGQRSYFDRKMRTCVKVSGDGGK